LRRVRRSLALLAVACLVTAPLLGAQAPRRPETAAPGTAPRSRAAPPQAGDTTRAAWVERFRSDSAYIALLEKLNDQLGWRWNPVNVTVTLMGVTVAVLGLLFAGGTVVAAWVLYRQSREFREQSEQSIREHRAILGAIVETWRRETDAAFQAKMAEYDKSIIEQQAKLDALTGASAEQREQVERDLERLKRERDAASASELEKLGAGGAAGPAQLGFTGTFPVPGRRMTGFIAQERRYCVSCGQEFHVPEAPTGTAEHSTTGARDVFCPHCGARNRV
jgi:DNA-directed RNA polymerase subunit RPC12/RpoP